jgi:hypothetical protein
MNKSLPQIVNGPSGGQRVARCGAECPWQHTSGSLANDELKPFPSLVLEEGEIAKLLGSCEISIRSDQMKLQMILLFACNCGWPLGGVAALCLRGHSLSFGAHVNPQLLAYRMQTVLEFSRFLHTGERRARRPTGYEGINPCTDYAPAPPLVESRLNSSGQWEALRLCHTVLSLSAVHVAAELTASQKGPRS